MSDDITDLFVHTVSVQTWLGSGAAGDVYAPAATVAGFLEGAVHLVRAKDGQQVVAQSTFHCSVADGAKFTPDSKVTFTNGRTAQVITVSTHDAGGLLDGIEHTAVHLT